MYIIVKLLKTRNQVIKAVRKDTNIMSNNQLYQLKQWNHVSQTMKEK